MTRHQIQAHWPGSCFGCSSGNPHGLQLRFSRTLEGCTTTHTVPEHLCGFDGLTHGGIIATLLDEVAAWAIIARLNRLGLTREMTTRYLMPVPTNRELVVTGTVLTHDNRSATVRATIHSDGVLLAEADSSWSFPRLSRIANLANVPEERLQQFLDEAAG